MQLPNNLRGGPNEHFSVGILAKARTYTHSSLLLISTALFTPAALAQSAEFADDFSTNSIRFGAELFNEEGATSSIEPELGFVRMSSAATEAQNGQARLRINESTNSLQITGRLDPESVSLTEGYTQIAIDARIANDIAPEERTESNESVGDIFLGITSAVFNDGSATLFICLSREGEENSEELNLFDNGTTSCRNYDEFAPLLGDDIAIGYSIDTDNVLNLTLAGTTDSITLPGTFNPPSLASDQVAAQSSGGAGSSGTFLLTSITTDSGTEDFSTSTPVVDRYSFNVPGLAGFPTIVDERLRADFTAEQDGGNTVQVSLQDVGTYFEATTELSSESSFTESDQRVGSEVLTVMGNDTQDNGFDGLTGDIRASIAIELRRNGLRRIEFCLFRFDDSEGNNRSDLLNGGEDGCLEFPEQAQLDVPYRQSIDFNTETNTITFRVNGFTHSEILAGGLFAANTPEASASIFGNSGARFVGFIDDIRNSPTALTSTETDIPATFPSQIDTPEELDSTLDAPYDFDRTPITFIDDFSTDTSVLGINEFNADASFTYTDNAVEIQAHSTREPEDGGGGAAFDIRGVNDTVIVRGAISSDSLIGPGNRHGISLDINVTIFNDTVDGGLENEEGDIEARIRIEIQGNGRRRIQAEYRRRSADGNNDRLNVFPNGENRYEFNGLIPELDTFYTMTLQLDRENQQFNFGVDNEFISVPITGGVFEASRNRVSIVAYHQGSSGRTEIQLESIEIDDQLFDFAQQAPLLAPYRPRFQDEALGVATTVVDGRLRLETDGRISPDRDSQIRIEGRSTFVGADLELSSESIVASDERVFVGVSGLLYSEQEDSQENATGRVFVALRMHLEGDGNRFVEACAFRSNDENFDSSDQIIGDDTENCPRLNFVPELDTAYPASIEVDETANTITFNFADETLVHDITSEIFTDVAGFNGTRARTDDNSKVVAFADNLAFSANPEPLAESDQNFGNIVGISDFTSTDTDGDNNGTVSSGGSSGGGGCSIGGSGNPILILLALLAFVRVFKVRNKLKS